MKPVYAIGRYHTNGGSFMDRWGDIRYNRLILNRKTAVL